MLAFRRAGWTILLVFCATTAAAQGSDDCPNLAGIDFGPCDAVLGWGIIDFACTQISGCQAPSGVTLFATEDECVENCQCQDWTGFDFGLCALILGWGIVNGDCVLISGCSAPSPGLFASETECAHCFGPVALEETPWSNVKKLYRD